MTRYHLSAIFFVCLLLALEACVARRTLEKNASAPASGIPTPPVAERRPHKLVMHQDVREDAYYWLMDKERNDPDVLGYLEAENNYTEAVMSDTEQLQETLHAELQRSWQEDDEGVPQRKGGYFYYARTAEGQEYDVYCRRKIPYEMGAPSELDEMDENVPEEVLLDVNGEAEGHSEYYIEGFKVSPDNKLIMYGVDTTGSENYTIHVKEISTGKDILSAPITGVGEDMEFASDSETIFYVAFDERHRPKTVWRHKIGTSPKADVRMYKEEEEPFLVKLRKSKDENFVIISTETMTTSEELFLDAANPDGEFRVVNERRPNVHSSSEHRDGYIYTYVTDDGDRPNGEVVVAPVSEPANQKVLIPHRNDSSIDDLKVFKNFLAVIEKKKAVSKIKVYKLPKNESVPESLGKGKEIEFEEDNYVPEIVMGRDFDSDILRISYTSLTTPDTIIDYNMATGKRSVKHADAILGGFNASDYKSEVVWTTANGSENVPISLVYRKDAVKLDGSDPLVLDVYGAFGKTLDPSFSRNRLPYIDRGFVYAIAHVRGGGGMGGRYWWDGGKLMKRKNTFTDLIACAEELMKRNYTSPDGLIVRGTSAGGTAVGVAINMRPDLFKAAVLKVPSVDVLTTMSDESQPMTMHVVEDWGNPRKDEDVYFYMKSYSPVDNIEAKGYPHIFVTCGLNDKRVGYWEAAKYTAKLRSLKTDGNLLIMLSDMAGGHFSTSSRFDFQKETALEYAFYLQSVGKAG